MIRSLIVMGVSGSGKSTIGAELARKIGAEFVEGDDLHPAANRRKMASGLPLNDEDRRPWLHAIARAIQNRDAGDLVISCSALRRRYRDIIREQAAKPVLFLYLRGSESQLRSRLAQRKDHFMPALLLASQLEALEPPDPDEPHLSIDIGQPAMALIAELEDGIETLPDGWWVQNCDARKS